MCREGIGCLSQFLQDVPIAVVEQRVHGIQAQTIDVVLAQPHQGVVDDVRPYGGLVEVDGVTPGVPLAGAQVRPELGQVVAARPEMVVDDVLDDRETRGVGGVDEALVGARSAVRLVDGVPEHPVVPPVVHAVEAVDGQQFDVGHAEFDQVREPLDCSIQCPLGRESSDVEFVDDPARQLATRPVSVGPGEVGQIDVCGCLVHTPRLALRARIRAGRPVVDDEPVFLGVGENDIARPPTVRGAFQLELRRVPSTESDLAGVRCPNLDAHVPSLSSGTAARPPLDASVPCR